MQYAIIQTGGKQYQVHVGEVLSVEKLTSASPEVVFDQVLLTVDGDQIAVGTPTLTGIKVYATIQNQVKGDKIEVFKFKSKSRYRKHTGHRQQYTQIKINSIGEEPKIVKAVKKTPVVKKPSVAKKKTPVKKSSVK